MSASMRIGVRHERRADDPHWRRVGEIGRGTRDFLLGRRGLEQGGDAGNEQADRGDCRQQHHVAIFFPDSHAGKTRGGGVRFQAADGSTAVNGAG